MQTIRYSRYFKTVFILLDVIVIAGVITYFFYSKGGFDHQGNWEMNILPTILLIFFWILLSGRTKLYSIERNDTYMIFLDRLVTHIVIFLVGLILLAKISNNELLKFDRFKIAIALFILLFFLKSALFSALKYFRTFGFNHRNVMFLGENSSSEILKEILNERKDYGFKIFEFPQEETQNLKLLTKFWKDNGIHTMFIPSDESSIPEHIEKKLFTLAELNKVRISLVPSIKHNHFFQYELGYVETQPVLVQTKFPLDFFTNVVIKRAFDILFSALVLLFICSWLFPIIALLIRRDSKGPIFFIQKRYGYHDEVFNVIKFRTMKMNGDSSRKTTDENDTRITRIGKILRKTSLDELPQFINVLKGEMSVVGPRPHMLLVDDYYKMKIGRYSVRSLVKPGVTGLAQVNGLRGDVGDMDREMKKRILTDSFYVKNWSLSLDFVIILKTIFLLIVGDKNAR